MAGASRLLLAAARCCCCCWALVAAAVAPAAAAHAAAAQRPNDHSFSDDSAAQALQGFESGLMTDQPRSKYDQCMGTLNKVSGPLHVFMQSVATSCSSSLANCVAQLSEQVLLLSNSTGAAHTHIRQNCPKGFDVIFTAVYNPFLPMSMATLAVLHARQLTLDLNMMFQALERETYEDFGFYLGRAVDDVLPLVRLPLKDAELRLVVRGFVAAFMPGAAGHPGGLVPSIQGRTGFGANASFDAGVFEVGAEGHRNTGGQGAGVGAAAVVAANGYGGGGRGRGTGRPRAFGVVTGYRFADVGHEECLRDVRSNLAPANEALEDILGSLLNMTCYKEVIRFQGLECLQRAFHGITTFASSLHAMYSLLPRLEQAKCPPEFVGAMERLRNEAQLALDVATNSVTDFIGLESDIAEATDLFFDDQLVYFGYRMGCIYEKLTKPSFYRYQRIKFSFEVYMLPFKAMFLALFAPTVLLLSALPLLCLFCSAWRGWPPEHDDIVVMPSKGVSQSSDLAVDISHEFFGGRRTLGSHMEIVVEGSGGGEEQNQGEEDAGSGSESLWRRRTELMQKKQPWRQHRQQRSGRAPQWKRQLSPPPGSPPPQPGPPGHRCGDKGRRERLDLRVAARAERPQKEPIPELSLPWRERSWKEATNSSGLGSGNEADASGSSCAGGDRGGVAARRRPTVDDKRSSFCNKSADFDEIDARLLLTLTDEPAAMGHGVFGSVRSAFWSAVGFIFPCLGRGMRRWKLRRFGWEADAWHEHPDEEQANADSVMNGASCGKGFGCGACGEGLHSKDGYVPGHTGREKQFDNFVEATTHLDFEPVKPPVRDSAMAIRFSVHRVRMAVLRIRPAQAGVECADVLLLLSATLQAASGAWHLLCLLIRPWDVLFQGEILTFWLHYCRLASALLVVHKKVHAVWYTRVHQQQDVLPSQARQQPLCWCCFRFLRRTPAPVHLFASGPAMKTTEAPLLRFAYTKSCRLEAGDEVRILNRFHERHEEVGVLDNSQPDVAMRYRVDFLGDEGGAGSFLASELELVDEVARRQRTPLWRDRFTPSVVRATACLWACIALLLVLFGEVLSDDDGYLVLSLQAPSWREPLASWTVGATALVQLVCIVVEYAGRIFEWLLISCATAIVYAV